MAIIENFKLDVADDNDLTFAEVGSAISLMVDFAKSESPKIARQKIINRFAEIIKSDYSSAEEMVLKTIEQKSEIQKIISERKAQASVRSFNRSLKNLEKFISQNI